MEGLWVNVEKNNREYGMWGYMECGVQPADSNKYHPWPSPPPDYSQWAQVWELRKVRVGQVPTRIQNRVLMVSWFCLSLLPWLSTATSASFKEFTRETAYSGELQWSLYFRERTSCLIASQRHHLRASARRVTHVTIVFCDQLLTFLRYIFEHNHWP